MTHRIGKPLAFLAFALLASSPAVAKAAEPVHVALKTPMSPPTWALLERELIRAETRACQEFYDRYFDDRGYLECVERWGGDDGPDDAIENLAGWPVLHAVGAPDVILQLYKRAWEGHLRQFTLAKTTDVDFARDGMYYKEFPVKFDWLHNAEGLRVFNLQGLSDPNDLAFRRRVVRFAGFYLNEEPGADNYDPKHKIIRSLFNGSRGPLLRKATGLDWAGDPIEVEGRFRLGHGERSYAEMVEHFKDYNDIVGDHPQNLLSTTLALNAYMLTHEPKYREWLLAYVDAWRQRILDNNGIIPTNIGLDGKIGGAVGGKWYGGVYGWGFTIYDPASGKPASRNTHGLGIVGFGNAYMLTGDDKFLDAWRKMIDVVNSHKKEEGGRTLYPHMYGDRGWYDYSPAKYENGAFEIWYWSMKPADRARLGEGGWLAFLEGKDPTYPERAFRADLDGVRKKVAGIRADTTTPDTRLSDDPMRYNPADIGSLTSLVMGGYDPGRGASVLHSRLRYFDPIAKRAGLPEDVAALVEKLTADDTVVTLVNLDLSDAKTVVVQAGGYAEHRITSVAAGDATISTDRPEITVTLAPGAGGQIRLGMKRYVNTPTLAMPWDRR